MYYFRNIFCFLIFIVGSAFVPNQRTFEEQQKLNERVSAAWDRKNDLINMRCRALEIPEETFGKMLIRVFKAEGVMEIWVEKPDGKFIKFNEIKIYAASGKLGPKRCQGDCQVPEGYYYVSDFNPNSNYYLSLGINYPNQSDMILSTFPHKGGDIYIHGARCSAGCMAMSNYYIEDIYICAVKAHSNGQQKIPVWIYPFKPTNINLAYYNQYGDCKPFDKLWRNMAQGYQFFEKNKRLPDISVDSYGYYQFSDPTKIQANIK
jgi:murein L,D-transpeptidase YafK